MNQAYPGISGEAAIPLLFAARMLTTPIWQEAMDDLTPRERELMEMVIGCTLTATVTWDDDGLWLNGQLWPLPGSSFGAWGGGGPCVKQDMLAIGGRPGGLSLVVGYL